MKSLVEVLGFAALALIVLAGGGLLVFGETIRYIEFAQPLWFFAGFVPVIALILRARFFSRPATLQYSRAKALRRMSPGWGVYVAQLPDGLRLAAAMLLVFALARPQSTRINDRSFHEGIDIAVAVDLSESMATPDMIPTRLDAAKLVLDEFIRRRPHDRIAVVAFGEGASTISPLTVDHEVVRALVSRLRLGVLPGQRTAIGAGIGVSLNRLDESEAKTKVIVLLTDGVHNAGGVDPDTVAQEAADRGVKMYTVLMGRHEGGSIDPGQLERIAGATGGFAYTAEDSEKLTTSFLDLLDKLEKSRIEGDQIRAELFVYFVWPALILLLIEVLLRNTRLRRFP